MFQVENSLYDRVSRGLLLGRQECRRLADVAVDLDSEAGGELVVGEEPGLEDLVVDRHPLAHLVEDQPRRVSRDARVGAGVRRIAAGRRRPASASSSPA